MAANDLISNLVRDLEPVSPLALPRVRLSRWVLIAVPSVVLAVAVLGLRGDLLTAVTTLPFHAHAALLLIAAATSAIAALALAIPGEAVGLWRRTAPVAAILSWGAWLAAELLLFAAGGDAVWPVASGWGCVAKSFAIGVTPGLVLAIMVGRGAPADRRLTVIFAGLAAAAVGAFGVEVTCPLTSPMHLLLWHAGPVVAVVLLASVFGRAMFAAFTSTLSRVRG